MIYLQSLIFTGFFYFWTGLWSVLGVFASWLPRRHVLFAQEYWSRGMQVAIPLLTGIKIRMIGENNVPKDQVVIIACKHQSTWETTVFQGYLKDPAIVLKEELRHLPFFGWYVRKLKMIGVDRKAGSKALRGMIKEAKAAVEHNRKIVIYPEGTRVSGDTEGDIQAGIYALYSMLKIPVIPVGINAGVIWPRNTWVKKKGTLYMEFLPAIEPGLSRDDFMARLSRDIGASTKRLEAAALAPPQDLGPTIIEDQSS